MNTNKLNETIDNLLGDLYLLDAHLVKTYADTEKTYIKLLTQVFFDVICLQNEVAKIDYYKNRQQKEEDE